MDSVPILRINNKKEYILEIVHNKLALWRVEDMRLLTSAHID